MTDAHPNTPIAPIVFIIDCDNTLLRNDDVKDAMNQRLINLDGQTLADEFWRVYEDVRRTHGTVDLPETFAKFRPYLASDEQLDAVRSAIMDFPFQDYLYPETLDTLTTLKRHGLPVIVSDGDPIYQPHKIQRSGLASAVDGHWVVYIHKQQHVNEIMQRWPAPLYVMIDDKAPLLAAVKSQAPDRFVTIHINQGHYADEVAKPAPDFTLEHIGEVQNLDFGALLRKIHA